MQDIFDYATSPLNPALKLVILLLFILITGLYVWASREHSGRIRTFILFLIGFGLFFAVGALFRYFGHGIEFGFTKDFSLKWFQSLAYVIGSIFFVLSGRELTKIIDVEDK